MLKKIIISKGRASTINTHKLLNEYVVLCPESEKSQYEKFIDKDKIETIPDKIKGLAGVRNWVIKNYKEDVIMLDDDITAFYYIRDKAYRIKDKDVVDQILNNVYVLAKDCGVRLFSINQTYDPKKYLPTSPFKLKGWVGSVVGIIGKDLLLDETNKVRVDVDYSLQSLMKDRMIFVDNRFAFYSKKNFNGGGNSINRSEENLINEKKYLKEKWGKYIHFGNGKQSDLVNIRVEREDKIDI